MPDNSLSPDKKEYLDRYCNKHKVPEEEAKNHAVVNEVFSYYDTQTDNHNKLTNSSYVPSSGCDK